VNDYSGSTGKKRQQKAKNRPPEMTSDRKQIEFKSEKDLLKKISAKKDGIIIKDGNHQAVYLPSVWEQLPEKSEFLNSLKVKAGLSEDYFSENFEAYKFAATYIKEK
jgi:AMMECR1 domain-containing protein